ncbi:MAG: radical SAM protein, partial [Promethearchaeota archaeon]
CKYSRAGYLRYISIPIQSCSDKILRDMQRGYTSKKLDEIFSKIRDSQLNVSTDIMIGFPGEIEIDFKSSFNFLRKFKPLLSNVLIQRYSKRKNTKAYRMKNQISEKVKKERVKILSEFLRDNNIPYRIRDNKY